MAAARTAVPAYKRIQESILKRIENGRLRPGDPVQSERELARIHGVSLMTARQALGALERTGLVERRRGTGTFVAVPRVHFNKLMSFTEQLAVRGLRGHSRTLASAILTDTDSIAAKLSLSPKERILKIERLRFGGDEPFAVEAAYLSADRFPNLVKRSLQKESLFSVLNRENDITVAHADEEVDATSADDRTAELLRVPPGAPLLRMRQLIFTKAGQPIIYMLGLYRSDRHSLMIRRFR